MNESDIEAVAAELEAAAERGEHFPAAWANRLALDDAYRVLLARMRRRDTGARRIGWKVGLTATAIQQQFGVHEPVFACLLADRLARTGHAFCYSELIKPGFENELCIELGRDLAADATRSDIAAAVAAVYPAFEIIETRGDLSGQLALAIAADNAQQHSFVLGPVVKGDALPDLAAVRVRVRINDAEVDTALGDAVLGHPFNSVAWLAGKLGQFGEKLRGGDYIMSGSFTRQFALHRGDRITATFDGIGEVTASFA